MAEEARTGQAESAYEEIDGVRTISVRLGVNNLTRFLRRERERGRRGLNDNSQREGPQSPLPRKDHITVSDAPAGVATLIPGASVVLSLVDDPWAERKREEAGEDGNLIQ